MRRICLAILALTILAAMPPLGLSRGASSGPAREATPEPVEGPAPVPVLVVDVREAEAGLRLQVRSLQGLLNRERARVFVTESPRDDAWLKVVQHWTGRALETITAAQFLERFRDRVAGQVLCDPGLPFTVALGATAAGARGALLSATDTGLPTLLDTRRLTAAEAAERLLTDFLAQTDPGGLVFLDDQADLVDVVVSRRWLALTPEMARAWNTEQRATLAQHLTPGASLIGHPSEEGLWLTELETAPPAATRGAVANLSFFGILTPPRRLTQLRYLTPRVPEIKYVAFLFAGGDDLSFLFDGMAPAWNLAPLAGLPLGWTVPATAVNIAPLAVHTALAAALTRGFEQFVLEWGAASFPGRAEPATLGATVRALVARSGLTTALVRVTQPWNAADLTAFCRASGLEALFVSGPNAPAPGQFGETTVITVEPPITDPLLIEGAIRRQAAARDFVPVLVDPRAVAPADVRRVVATLGPEFHVVGTAELIELQRQAALDIQPTPRAERRVVQASLRLTPPQPEPDEPVTISARVEQSPPPDLVRIIYQTPSGQMLAVPAARAGDAYTATLPPLLPGGEFHLSVQTLSHTARESRSEPITVTVAAPDDDRDGLTDAQEHFARTDAHHPDTDRDGLRDGNDLRPRFADRPVTAFLDPVQPPYDRWLLATAGHSRVVEGARTVHGDAMWSYHLPQWAIPEGATLAMELQGAVLVSVSTDGVNYRAVLEEDVPERATHLVPLGLPQDVERVFIRFEARGEGTCTLSRFAVVSDPVGPFVPWTRVDPPLGVPGLELSVLARVYDPTGLRRVWLASRARSGGEIRIPMEEDGHSQVYRARLRDLRDRDRLTYRVIAETPSGQMVASRPLVVPVGRAPIETYTPTAAGDFRGAWLPHDAWSGQAKISRGSVCVDQVKFDLGAEKAQPFVIWLLGAPQGREIIVRVYGKEVGRVRANAGSGWHRIAARRITPGLVTVEVAAGERDRPEAEALYAQVILTRARTLEPPEAALLPYYDRLVLFGPAPGTVVSGVVTVHASVSGNVQYVKLYVNDEEQPGTYIRPPYHIEWDSRSVPNGDYTLRVAAFGPVRNLPIMEVRTRITVQNEPE